MLVKLLCHQLYLHILLRSEAFKRLRGGRGQNLVGGEGLQGAIVALMEALSRLRRLDLTGYVELLV